MATIKKVLPLQYSWLETEVKNKYTSFTLKNIYKYIYQHRGILAHGSLRSAKYVFNDDELHNITIFISQICMLICGNMQVYCMSSEESKRRGYLKD